MIFELTNDQRHYLGLETVKDDWDIVQLSERFFAYFDQNVIRKLIEVDETSYYEYQLDAVTDESRTYLLPRTSRGKRKRLTAASVAESPRHGVYFAYDHMGASIANYTTQTTYFACAGNGKPYRGFEELMSWLNHWIADTTEDDLNDLATFKCAKREHHVYREGDFFAFKIGRREYGFGRILMNIDQLRKCPDFAKTKNQGLGYMGKPLIVKVFHYIYTSPSADLEALRNQSSFPSQPIMDNSFFYGEYRIIGHSRLVPDELEFPIIFGRSLDVREPRTVFLQYGQIYCETDIAAYQSNSHAVDGHDSLMSLDNSFRTLMAGFRIDVLYDVEMMKQCIAERSNQAMWAKSNDSSVFRDFRDPKYTQEKLALFHFFGLDAKADYYENLIRLNTNGSTALPDVLRYVVDPSRYET